MNFDILDPHLDLSSDYFIEAAAGSGKTFSIEMFVLRLFLEKEIDLSKILIVTFTNKAKEELSRRIFDRIEQSYQESKNQSPQDEKRLVKIKQALYQERLPKVETLHSFCLTESKNLGHLASTVNSDSFEDFMQFLKFHTVGLSNSELMLVLKAAGDFQTLYLRVKRLEKTEKKKLSLQEALRTFKQNIVGDLYQDLLSLSANFSNLANRQGELKEENRKLLARFTDLFQNEIDDKSMQLAIACGTTPLHLFTKPKVRTKKVSLQDPNVMEKIEKLGATLEYLRSENYLLSILQENYIRYLNQKGLTFSLDDMLEYFHNNIKEHEIKKIQDQFDVVFIDEFQDTDWVQWQIFSKIFFGVKQMVIVGDPKQSIYGFRKADLYVYEKVKNQFAHVVSLTKNFRTRKTIIDQLNRFFSLNKGILWLPKEQIVHDFSFAEAVHLETSFLRFLVSSDEKSRTQNEAALFYEFLHYLNEVRSQQRELQEIAFIVKDRYQGQRLSDFFAEHHIEAKFSYEVVLGDLGVFQEFYQLFDSLIHSNIFLFKGFLTKELFGITQSELERWSENGLATFFLDLKKCLHQGIFAVLYHLKTAPFFHFDPRSFADAIQIAEHLEKKLFEKNKSPLQALTLLKEIKTLWITKQQGEQGVEIITNHRAKGLEFDVVFFLAGYLNVPRGKEKQSLEVLLEKQAEKLRNLYVGLTRAKKELYVCYVPSKSLQLETSSLLDFYYAFTKVTELTAQTLDKELKELTKEKIVQWFSQVGEVKEVALQPMEVQPENKNIPVQQSSPFTYLPKEIPLTSFSSETRELVLEKKSLQTAEPTGPIIGQFFHEVMDRMFTHRYKAGVDIAWVQHTIDHVIPPHFSSMKPFVEKWAENIRNHPFTIDGHSFFLFDLPYEHVYSEREFLTFDENKFIKGFIDLIFIFQDKVFILDWKTNVLPCYDQEHLHKEMMHHQYYYQAELYKKAVMRMKPFKDLAFGGAVYLFVRGIDQTNMQLGTMFFDPSEVWQCT